MSTFLVVEKQLKPQIKLAASEETRLISEQNLLSQKHKLQQRLNQFDGEYQNL
jgi:hypothetical protein